MGFNSGFKGLKKKMSLAFAGNRTADCRGRRVPVHTEWSSTTSTLHSPASFSVFAFLCHVKNKRGLASLYFDEQTARWLPRSPLDKDLRCFGSPSSG